jgi:hypothetical protein
MFVTAPNATLQFKSCLMMLAMKLLLPIMFDKDENEMKALSNALTPKGIYQFSHHYIITNTPLMGMVVLY